MTIKFIVFGLIFLACPVYASFVNKEDFKEEGTYQQYKKEVDKLEDFRTRYWHVHLPWYDKMVELNATFAPSEGLKKKANSQFFIEKGLSDLNEEKLHLQEDFDNSKLKIAELENINNKTLITVKETIIKKTTTAINAMIANLEAEQDLITKMNLSKKQQTVLKNTNEKIALKGNDEIIKNNDSFVKYQLYDLQKNNLFIKLILGAPIYFEESLDINAKECELFIEKSYVLPLKEQAENFVLSKMEQTGVSKKEVVASSDYMGVVRGIFKDQLNEWLKNSENSISKIIN